MGARGLWTHAELDAAGVPRSTVRDRVHRGRWVRVLPGVFAESEPDALGLCRAVALWRPDAVLSHRSAAALWGLGEHPDVVGATVARMVRLRTPAWLQLHRRNLPAAAVTTGWGLRLVTPERALVDVLQVERGPAADVRVDAALSTTVSPWSLQRVRERDAGAWGVGPTDRQLRTWAGPVESEPERLLGRALRRRRRTFETGARVLGYRCDFLHRPSWTVVEVDGLELHTDAASFVRDRVRQNALQRQGLLGAALPGGPRARRRRRGGGRDLRRRRRAGASAPGVLTRDVRRPAPGADGGRARARGRGNSWSRTTDGHAGTGTGTRGTGTRGTGTGTRGTGDGPGGDPRRVTPTTRRTAPTARRRGEQPGEPIPRGPRCRGLPSLRSAQPPS